MKYPMLQSGFVSLYDDGLTIRIPSRDRIVRSILQKDYLAPNNENKYDPEVDDIYRAYLADKKAMRSFEFRERVLKAAIANFRKDTFDEWVEFQNATKLMAPIHVEFVEETIKYVWYGRKRLLTWDSWGYLVENKPLQNNHRIDIPLLKATVNFDSRFDTVKDIILEREHLGSEAWSLDHFLSTWVSREGGFNDLLETLNVVFGDRPGVANVYERDR